MSRGAAIKNIPNNSVALCSLLMMSAKSIALK